MQYILLISTSLLLLLGGCRSYHSNYSAKEYGEFTESESTGRSHAEGEYYGSDVTSHAEYEYASYVVTPPAANAYNSGEKIVYAISTANNIYELDLDLCTSKFIKRLPSMCIDRDARPAVVSKLFIDYQEYDVIIFDADYCQISISPEYHRGSLFITDNASSGYGDIKEMSVANGQDMDYGDYNISIESGIIHIGYCGEDYVIRLEKPSFITSAIRWNFPFGVLILLLSIFCIIYVIISLSRPSRHKNVKAERKTILTIKELSTMDIDNILQFADKLERESQITAQQQGNQHRSEQQGGQQGSFEQQGCSAVAPQRKGDESHPVLPHEGLLQGLPDSLPDSIPPSITSIVLEQAKRMASDAAGETALQEIVSTINEGKAIWEALSRIGEITEELSKIDDIIIYRLTEGYELTAIARSVREKCAELSERFREESRLLYMHLSNADIASLESIGLGARSSFYRDFLLLLVFIDYKSKIGIRKIALLTDSTLATVHARKAELLKNKLGSNIERLAEDFNPISLIIKRAYNNLNNI